MVKGMNQHPNLKVVPSIHGHGEGTVQAVWTQHLPQTVGKTHTWYSQAPSPLPAQCAPQNPVECAGSGG